MKKQESRIAMSFIWGRFKTRTGLSQAMEQNVDKEISQSETPLPKTASLPTALNCFFQRVAPVTNLVVFCGSQSTSMDAIEDFLAQTNFGKTFLEPGEVLNFASFRKNPTTNTLHTLLLLLLEISSSLATEPKDMVYALLGLTSDRMELLPLPDYKQPPISHFTKLHLLR
jgi:hypothetical protein